MPAVKRGRSAEPAPVGRPRKPRSVPTAADVKEACQMEGLASVRTVVRIRDNRYTPAGVKLACAQWLVERGFGKVENRVALRKITDITDLQDDELIALAGSEAAAILDEAEADGDTVH